MGVVGTLKRTAKKLKVQLYILYYAARHPGTPWYAKLVIAGVVAYALSPVDLIPDFIPVLGYLDDLIILPLGISLALRLVPKEILDECADKADKIKPSSGKNWRAAICIIAIWCIVLGALGKWLWSLM